jgi:hypothetical protein
MQMFGLKVFTAAMAAVIALSLLAGSASALRSLSITGSTTLTLNGRLTLSNSVGDLICNMTVTKTISRVIPKIANVLIGKITRIDTARPREANCMLTGEEFFRRLERIEFLLEREERARIFKGTILGTLPNITGILVSIDQLRGGFVISGNRCLYETPREGLGELAEVNREGLNGRLIILSGSTESLIEGGAFCPSTFELRGSLTPLQRTFVRLI